MKRKTKRTSKRVARTPAPSPKRLRLTAETLQRTPLSVEIPSSLIYERENIEEDKIFVETYTKFLRGKTTITSTRLALSMITEGFYRPGGGNLEYVCDNPDDETVEWVMGGIRRGHRPSLYIYKNINADDPKPFVCPDDVSAYRAYARLGIAVVPVKIMSQGNTSLTESGIILRSYPTGKAGWPPAYMEGTTSTTHALVPTFLGPEPPWDHAESFAILRRCVLETIQKLQAFHDRDESDFHYHHTLHSYLYRLDEAILACSILIQNQLWYQAVPILRSIYEASLNFYLEWLSPENIHFYFKLTTRLKTRDVEKLIEAIGKGDNPAVDRASNDSLRRMTTLVSNVRKKAEMSPVGLDFHERIYSFLSGVAHQDFHLVAEYANTFLGEAERPEFVPQDQRFVIQCLDVIAALICTRITDDVGAPADGILIDA